MEWGEELCSKGEGHYVPQKIIFQWGGECNHVRTLLEEDKTGTICCEARKDITLNCIMLNQVTVSPVSEEIFYNVMIEVGMREGATDPNTLWE